MKNWEIELACEGLVGRLERLEDFTITQDEFNEILKASLEEKERIHNYYLTPVITYNELNLPVINGSGKSPREMLAESR